jgi:hypothetical protein
MYCCPCRRNRRSLDYARDDKIRNVELPAAAIPNFVISTGTLTQRKGNEGMRGFMQSGMTRGR